MLGMDNRRFILHMTRWGRTTWRTWPTFWGQENHENRHQNEKTAISSLNKSDLSGPIKWLNYKIVQKLKWKFNITFVISWVTRLWFLMRGGGDLSLRHYMKTHLRSTRPHISSVHGIPSPGIELLQREYGHSPASSSKVTNALSVTSTPVFIFTVF